MCEREGDRWNKQTLINSKNKLKISAFFLHSFLLKPKVHCNLIKVVIEKRKQKTIFSIGAAIRMGGGDYQHRK